MGQRQKMLAAAVATGISDLRAETARVINIRRRDLADQAMELHGDRKSVV